MANSRVDSETGVETVGHEWDGIEELNNPLPRWWLLSFYACIVFAIGYVIVYPAIPLLDHGTQGLWGWTSRGQLAAETKVAESTRAATLAALTAMPVEKLPDNPELVRAAVSGGKAAFRVNCVQCHGAGGGGNIGYPNLNDDEWLWGGNLKEIEQTITHGIRQPGDAQTRTAQNMPSFGREGILTASQVEDVASYVRTLSGKEQGGTASTRGGAIFAANCVACHGPDGKGLRQFGAPNLTDAIWLYGSSREAIIGSVTNAHAGVMPAWSGKLDTATIRMLAAYVHSLGGGEDFTEAAARPAAPAPVAAPVAANAQP